MIEDAGQICQVAILTKFVKFDAISTLTFATNGKLYLLYLMANIYIYKYDENNPCGRAKGLRE